MSTSRRTALIALVLLIGAGSATMAARLVRLSREHTVRQQLVGELRTVTLANCSLKRYGGDNDGGYLLCGNLVEGVQSAYSYGIDTEDRWGCQVSKEQGITVHQYDCFTEYRPACDAGGVAVFHDECVGPKAETLDSNLFDTIAGQIAKNGDTGKRLLVKMDIEGAEWESLMATPDAVLDTIDQIAMEFHGSNGSRLGDARFVDVIRRLKQKFYLVNLHFNNHACSPGFEPLPGHAFQVLWVNKRIGLLDPTGPSPAPMSRLNSPDNSKVPDCQLADEGR